MIKLVKNDRLDAIDSAREASRQAAKIELAKLAQAQDKQDSWLGFTDKLSGTSKKRAISVLSKQVSVRNEFASRGEHIIRLVKAGWKVSNAYNVRNLVGPGNGFFRESQLTSIGLDFAEYLTSK